MGCKPKVAHKVKERIGAELLGLQEVQVLTRSTNMG
jgi:hypothetical protein